MCPGQPQIGSAVALFKGIGRDGSLQFGPDVCRITRRCGGHHNTAHGAVHDVTGHFVEVVVTDIRHIVIGDARSHSSCRWEGSDHGVLVDRDGGVVQHVGETECGPVSQGFIALMGSDIEIPDGEVGPGWAAKGNRQRARIALDHTEPGRRGQRSEPGRDGEPGPGGRRSG